MRTVDAWHTGIAIAWLGVAGVSHAQIREVETIDPIVAEVPRARDTSLSLVINGKSLHLNAAAEWNESNWGFGFEKEFDIQSRWVKVALANGFKDSLGEPSYMAGGGIKRRFRMVSDRAYVDLGAIGFLMSRDDINNHRPFPGVLPVLTVGTRAMAVNFTYVPESIVNDVTGAHLRDPALEGVVFIQLKFNLRPSGAGQRGPFLASSQ